MKICPLCHRRYENDALSFCQHDGGQLGDDGIEPSLEEQVDAEVALVPEPKQPPPVPGIDISLPNGVPFPKKSVVDLPELEEQIAPPMRLPSLDAAARKGPELSLPAGVRNDSVKFLLRAARRPWVPWAAGAGAIAFVVLIALIFWAGNRTERAISSAPNRTRSSSEPSVPVGIQSHRAAHASKDTVAVRSPETATVHHATGSPQPAGTGPARPAGTGLVGAPGPVNQPAAASPSAEKRRSPRIRARRHRHGRSLRARKVRRRALKRTAARNKAARKRAAPIRARSARRSL